MSQSEEEYEIEKIIGYMKRKGVKYFKIKWLGYDDSQNSWVSEENISSTELTSKYEEEYQKNRSAKNATKKGATKTLSKSKEPEKEDNQVLEKSLSKTPKSSQTKKSTKTLNKSGDDSEVTEKSLSETPKSSHAKKSTKTLNKSIDDSEATEKSLSETPKSSQKQTKKSKIPEVTPKTKEVSGKSAGITPKDTAVPALPEDETSSKKSSKKKQKESAGGSKADEVVKNKSKSPESTQPDKSDSKSKKANESTTKTADSSNLDTSEKEKSYNHNLNRSKSKKSHNLSVENNGSQSKVQESKESDEKNERATKPAIKRKQSLPSLNSSASKRSSRLTKESDLIIIDNFTAVKKMLNNKLLPDRVMGYDKSENGIEYLLKWSNGNEASYMSSQFMRDNCPQVLLDYLMDLVNFVD